jgi:hypothetical protein
VVNHISQNLSTAFRQNPQWVGKQSVGRKPSRGMRHFSNHPIL